MHKLLKWIFESLINIERFLRVVAVFFIMLIALFWIQNLIGATWFWMTPFAPILNSLLDFVNSIYSFSFDFWGKTIEIKYFNAVLLIIIFTFILKFISICLEKLYEIYEDAHLLYKKNRENSFNKSLNNSVKNNEVKINNYSVFIKTKITRRYINKQENIDIDSQNAAICKFMTEKTGIKAIENWGGYVFRFDNFEEIDNVLEIIQRIMASPAPLDYIVCIQTENDLIKLKQLIDLEEWNKVIISSETLCRYNYNKKQKYNTTNVGVFQKSNGTLEVYEFILE